MKQVNHEYKRNGITFRTRAEQVKENWYKWQIEVAGPPSELNQIREVEYILHPTFPNRINHRTDPTTNFRLESSGWGEFDITVNIYFHNGDEKTFIIPLKLS